MEHFPPRRRRWTHPVSLLLGLAIGTVVGGLAGSEYAVRDLQFALIAARGRQDVSDLNAITLADQLRTCEFEQAPPAWPPHRKRGAR